MRFSVLSPLLVTACLANPPSSSISGSSSDVHTAAGSYDGYDVVRACTACDHGTAVTLVGKATAKPTNASLQAWNNTNVYPAIRGNPHFSGLYASPVGQTGVGSVGLSVNDWREVDPLIQKLGPLVKAESERIDVDILVEAIPVAQ